jgi:hypothetical protein
MRISDIICKLLNTCELCKTFVRRVHSCGSERWTTTGSEGIIQGAEICFWDQQQETHSGGSGGERDIQIDSAVVS